MERRGTMRWAGMANYAMRFGVCREHERLFEGLAAVEVRFTDRSLTEP